MRDSRANKTRAPVKALHARKARRGGERETSFFLSSRRVSPFLRGVIFRCAQVLLALLSLREDDGLLEV